ncbi:hypothetical protein FACS1894145_5600 [Bacteroidia bacterium]|nr:hypothetical protein FACS1894145_5600 [Bacteroidia bacterium]
MKNKVILFATACIAICSVSCVQTKKAEEAQALFTENLSNADYNKEVWSVDEAGVISASADDALWTTNEYENFELSLEFKNDNCTNSGVVIYCTNKQDWIPNSVEIQIADDYCDKWDYPATWLCGAVFGHLAPTETQIVKKPGEWNSMKITAQGKRIAIELNSKKVTQMDMNLWTSGKINPDGSEIPEWLPTPFAELPTKGYIGFQGKHGEATIWFRNINIKELK